MKNNFLQQRTRKPATVPPGGEPIVRVAESMGLCVSFNLYVSRRGDGTETASVSVYRPGASCLRKGLGTLAKLSAMPEDELRQHIAARFAPGVAKDDTTIKGWSDY